MLNNRCWFRTLAQLTKSPATGNSCRRDDTSNNNTNNTMHNSNSSSSSNTIYILDNRTERHPASYKSIWGRPSNRLWRTSQWVPANEPCSNVGSRTSERKRQVHISLLLLLFSVMDTWLSEWSVGGWSRCRPTSNDALLYDSVVKYVLSVLFVFRNYTVICNRVLWTASRK